MALLEREAEIAQAHEALRDTAAGAGSLLIVTGPPGIGSSALLHHITEAAPAGAHLLRAGGMLTEQGFTFGVVHQLLHPLVAAATAAQRHRLLRGPAHAVRDSLAGESRAPHGAWRARTTEAILRGLHALVVNLSEDAPVILAVDDLQWADAASLRWLGHLAQHLDGARILVAAAITDDCVTADPALLYAVTRSATRTGRPRPLSASATRRLIADEYGEPCAGGFARACHQATGGNPAALLTVVRGLRERGIRPLPRQANLVGPQSEALLRSRRMFCLSIQPAIVRDLAQAMVILDDLGGAADPDLVAGLAGLDTTDFKTAVHALDRLGLLAATDPPRFVHQSVRCGADEAITVEARERLHGRAAVLLHDAGHPPERVADQLLLAPAGYGPWEIGVLRSAATAAMQRGDGKVAARYLRHALLDSAPGSAGRGRVLVGLADAERGFDLDLSVRHVTQAVPLLPAPAERAEAALRIPPALAAARPPLGELLGQVAADLDRDPRAPRDVRDRVAARLLYLRLQDPDALRAAGELLRTSPRDLSSGGARELLAVRVVAATLFGDLPAAELTGPAGDVLGRENPDPAYAYTALPQLIPVLAAADAPAVAAGWLNGVSGQDDPLAEAHRATLLRAAGRLAESREAALRSLSAVGETDDAGGSRPEPVAQSVWALALIALDTHDAELAERLLRVTPLACDLRIVAAHRMMRGLLDVIRGDRSAALDRFLDCGTQLTRAGWHNPALFPWRVWAATLYGRLGDADAAVALAEEELVAARRWGSPAAHGRALCLLGTLTGSVPRLREATEVLRASADRVELARATRALGASLGAAAEPVMLRARRLERECGVTFAGSGAAVLPETSSQMPLTQAEQAVCRLAARGWTNPQIADALGITRRAVEKTLTKLYRKLRVTGRAALIERAGHTP
jgi:DNA-binding CsgD family transcriptional regulator